MAARQSRAKEFEEPALGDLVATQSLGHRQKVIVPAGAAPERVSRVPLTKQQRLENCVQAILLRPDLPAFAHQVAEVLSIVRDEEASLKLLTRLVMRNYSLTSQLLRASNSLYYNRSGRSILSVSHAISYLGMGQRSGIWRAA